MKVRPLQTATFQKGNDKIHSDKHHVEYINDIRFKGIAYPSEDFDNLYNTIGKELSLIRVGKSTSSARYVGYIAKDHRGIKYDRYTKDYLVISNDGHTVITLYKKREREYKRVLKKDFLKEFDYNN